MKHWKAKNPKQWKARCSATRKRLIKVGKAKCFGHGISASRPGSLNHWWGKSRSGRKNPNWKGGKNTILPHCMDCNKLLTNRNNKRCKPCYFKTISGKNHYLWKGGIERFPNCKVCGKQLSYVKGKVCKDCSFGENTSNWNNGSSFEPYGLEFNNGLKDAIRKRDGFRCQQCFYHQSEFRKKLHIHHIDFNKRNNDSLNLISLCNKCHSQTQFNRQNWILYFQNRMRESGQLK